MWPLLFLLLAPSGPAWSSGPVVGAHEGPIPVAATALAPVERPPVADDGARRWAADGWTEARVRRRRAHRHLRARVRRRPPRAVRTDEAVERRRVARDAAVHIRRAAAVARRVALAARSIHTPSRAGFSDARPPAA